MKALIALLRAVNVGGRKVPMADLRALVTKLGCQRVESYIQSGNLVFLPTMAADAMERVIERALKRQFGFAVEVIARTGAAWQTYAVGSPFADAQSERPNRLILGLSKHPPKPEAATRLREYAKGGERIEVVGDAIWIDFGASIASSKLTPAVLDRIVGSTVTGRNWRTVQKLDAMARAIG